MSGYVMIPGWLLAKKPSANAVLAYATLAGFGTFDTLAGMYEECRPALATLADRSGLSLSTAKRALTELLELGAIARWERFAEDGRTQLPSVYRVYFGTLSGPGGSTGEPPSPSTGGPRGGSPVDYNQEPHTKNQDTKKPSATPRGTRIPEDWAPSNELKAWCQSKLPAELYQRAGTELTKFRNYWLAKTGKDATKLDWNRTFQNWMINASERYGSSPTSPAPAGAQTFKQMDQSDRAREDLIVQAMDIVLQVRPEMRPAQARVVVNDLLVSGQLDLNTLKSSVATSYTGHEVIAGEVKEVTGP